MISLGNCLKLEDLGFFFLINDLRGLSRTHFPHLLRVSPPGFDFSNHFPAVWLSFSLLLFDSLRQISIAHFLHISRR